MDRTETSWLDEPEWNSTAPPSDPEEPEALRPDDDSGQGVADEAPEPEEPGEMTDSGSGIQERDYTDDDNAERFADDHGDDLRYIGDKGQWVAWERFEQRGEQQTGGVWRLRTEAEVLQLARLTANRAAAEAHHRAEELLRLLTAANKRRVVENVAHDLRIVKGVVSGDRRAAKRRLTRLDIEADALDDVDEWEKMMTAAVPEVPEGFEPEQAKQLVSYYKRCAKEVRMQRRMTPMLALTAGRDGVLTQVDDWNQDPWLLNVANGTLDLRKGELRPHRKGDHITTRVPFGYDKDAEAPTWNKFVETVTCGDAELARYLQRAVGYSLTGSVREQVLFFCYGSGANGKSTLLQVLLELVGPDLGVRTERNLLMAKRAEGGATPGIADLWGKRCAIGSEIEEGRSLDEALIKDLTGGDRLRARHLHQANFEFDPMFKLWLAGNHKPLIRGTDRGVWRRMRLIPFLADIPEAEQDRDLLTKLRAELPGILAWAVEGCMKWQEHGLGDCAAVERSTAEYRTEMDTLGQFLDECCTVAPEGKVSSVRLYLAYKEWAEASGLRVPSKQGFGRKLSERPGIDTAKLDGGNTRGWKGVALRPGYPAEPF